MAETHRGPKRDRRRDEIISKAFDAFALGGFHGTTVQEIATAVGMSKAGLLHHFPSKEHLLLEVLKLRQEVNRIPEDVYGLAVLRYLRRVVELDTSAEGLTRLFVTVSAESTNPDHPAHEFFVERYANSTRVIATRFDEACASGELRADLDTVEAAHHVIAVLDGLQLQWLLNPQLDRVAEFDSFVELFLYRNATEKQASQRPSLSTETL